MSILEPLKNQSESWKSPRKSPWNLFLKKGTNPAFCTKAFNYNIFFSWSPVFSHFYEMTWKDFNRLPFCFRLPRVWKWNMPLEFMVCLVIRNAAHLKILLQYVQSCGERGWEFVDCNLFCHCLTLNKCCVFCEIFDVVTVIGLSPSTCSVVRYSR